MLTTKLVALSADGTSDLAACGAFIRADGRVATIDTVTSCQQGISGQSSPALPTGSRRYLCAPGTRQGGQDEWSTRANQALRFDTQVAAEEVAAGLGTNSSAKEYLAVKL